MRLMNRKQLHGIPVVDQGNLYFGESSQAAESNRIRLERERARAREIASRQRAMAARAQAQAEAARDLAAFRHAQMLERSLGWGGQPLPSKTPTPLAAYERRFGVSNALTGFGDVNTSKTVSPDYSASEVYQAQEFSNKLTAKDVRCYNMFKDYPMVTDAPNGDFGGLLVSEKGSPDFSTWIVNDVSSEFGSIPRRHRAPRRRL